jgi:hypothetical protein
VPCELVRERRFSGRLGTGEHDADQASAFFHALSPKTASTRYTAYNTANA